MKLLDGKALATKIKHDLKKKINRLKFQPGLAGILVGDNEASRSYVNLKEKACREVGLSFFRHELSPDTSEDILTGLIKTLNHDQRIHGILVQLPLPPQLNVNQIISNIDPIKDVDGFHPDNIKRMNQGQARVIQPPIAAVWELLLATGQDLSDLTAVILANSQEFAQPLQMYLSQKKIKSVSLIRPQKFSPLSRWADILITALGRPHQIKKPDIKPGAILIDVGFSRLPDGIKGDIDPESVKDQAAYLSPVPGGVGPLTVAFLLVNVVTLANLKSN